MVGKVDFLGIGAQKAATSWLYDNLQRHPAVWLPPIKELHYFDRSPDYPSPSYLASSSLVHRLVGREYFNRRFRKNLRFDLKAAFSHKDWKTIGWLLHYYLGTYSDRWYLSLFKPGKGKLRGEITPSYSILALADVQHIKDILPDLKIIFILRDPIDRAWSHMRFVAMLGMFDGISDPAKCRRFIDADDQALRSDYVRTLEIWRSCFSEEQMYIGFFDDIGQDPKQAITKIFDFLGLDSQCVTDDAAVNNRVNAADEMAMPDELKVYLARKYYPELQKLTAMVGGCAVSWLAHAEQILSVTDSLL